MAKMFSKQAETPKLFKKQPASEVLFRKISNTGRKVDNSVLRAGNFLIDTSKTVGLNALARPIKEVVDGVHNVRNSLEKSIRSPVSQLRHIN